MPALSRAALAALSLSLTLLPTAAAELDEPLGERGTLSFELVLDAPLDNGRDAAPLMEPIVVLPGLAKIVLHRAPASVDLLFLWENDDPLHRGFVIPFETLPAGRTHLLFTWDAERGRSEGYVGGTPVRFPGTRFAAWNPESRATEVQTPSSRARVERLVASPRFTTARAARRRTPHALRGTSDVLLGHRHKGRSPRAIDARKGALLVDAPLKAPENTPAWIVEGPARLRHEHGGLVLDTAPGGASTPSKGHFNLWHPDALPESFVIEWEFERLSETGFAILHFAARGSEGRAVFDPGLPARDGSFPQYVRGELDNYYVSFFGHLPRFQTGRIHGNLRKVPGYLLLDHGPVAIEPGARGWHRLRLVKDGPHIELAVDGTVSLAFTDDHAARYGAALAPGHFGFRQMNGTVGVYRHLKVWALEPAVRPRTALSDSAHSSGR